MVNSAPERIPLGHRVVVVLVPKGYHPVGLLHGYDLYYHNVMVGPVREWQFHNDPDHDWIMTKR